MFPAAIYAPAKATARGSPRPGYKWELLVWFWFAYLFGAALLLCSEAGRYITGQNLFIDGGMSL